VSTSSAVDEREEGLKFQPRFDAAGLVTCVATDATSGVTTYPAARGLSTSPPDADGRVTLDFNRASNLPCSFTDFATCPVAPAENRLPVAVEAGEKNPR